MLKAGRARLLICLLTISLAGQQAVQSDGARAQGITPPNGAVAGSARGALTSGGRSVLIALLPSGGAQLATARGMSLGLLSATQGRYSTEQLVLDIGQGARVAASAYSPSRPPALSLRRSGSGALVLGWEAALRRAEDAPQLLRPGLLAAQIPGGAGYAGPAGGQHLDGVIAADRSGRVAAATFGSEQTLLARVAALRRSKRLVVADLPAGPQGVGDLRSLAAQRAAGELLIVLQRAPDRPGYELLWMAAAGLPGGGRRELSSATTNQRGLIAAVDIAPTILEHLSLPIPAAMRGKPLRTDGPLAVASLRDLLARLRVLGARRLKALGCLLGAWALLLLGASAMPRAGRQAARGWTMRVGALALLWTPAAVLITAALEPGGAVEFATITLAALALGALSDLLLPWPRAPLLPALVVIALLLVDALAGTQLLVRSLLGPNPLLGARFYGFGNELKSGLAVLVLAAVAAALYPARAGSRAALAMAFSGVALAAIEGSARLGAGVGGVILVSAGFAVACVLLLPGTVTRRRALLVLASPPLALVALALLDLLSAHGSGHFTGSVLHARSPGDLRDLIVRRYKAAWLELGNHAMPVATAVALLCSAAGLHKRARLLAPVGGDPVWQAALAGGLTAGLVGTLSEDSGPVLLVVAVFALGCVSTYLWGRPAGATAQHLAAGRASAPRSAITDTA